MSQLDIKAQELLEPSVKLICATDIKAQNITWLWHSWLPLGKLTLLAGAGGTGKTTLAIALASIVTRGGRFPCGQVYAGGDEVLIYSSEDDAGDTLIPRLMAVNADLQYVKFIEGVTRNGKRQFFNPATDWLLLKKELSLNTKLIIIDPIVTTVNGDMHKANDVRASLQPLIDMANQKGIAILGISHLAKGSQDKEPTERIIGSQAFTATARMVWATAKGEDNQRVLVKTKSNIAIDKGGFFYQIEPTQVKGIDTTQCLFGEAIEGTGREILAHVEGFSKENKPGQLEQCQAFLQVTLADGKEIDSNSLESKATEQGFSNSTLKRAKKQLGVMSRKRKLGVDSKWYVWLPRQEVQTLPPENLNFLTPLNPFNENNELSYIAPKQNMLQAIDYIEGGQEDQEAQENTHKIIEPLDRPCVSSEYSRRSNGY